MTGLVGGIFHYYFIGLADTLSFMGFNFLTFCFYTLGAHLRHSHIRLSYPKWLSYLLISPLQHQVHHSYLDKHINKNFGGVFAIWDLWFKSLYFPKKNEPITLGVKDLCPELTHSIPGLYLSPFRNLVRIDFNAIVTKTRKLFTSSRRT
jgi:sterol desaturase/sphingolipid hydroxylase (fatty acid hydroxylase superfamily)